MKDIIIIYHGNCSDGFGGAWAAWKKFGKKADYIPAHHQESPLDNLKNKEIYFIDFFYKTAVIKKLLQQGNKITAIDHHITSKKDIELSSEFVFDNNHSGAVLAWRYFHPEKPVPRLLRQIEDFDLWKFKIPNTKSLMAYMVVINFNFLLWNKLVKSFETAVGRRKILEEGNCYLKFQDKLLKELVSERAYPVKFCGRKAMAVNAPHFFASDLGAMLYEKYYPIAIIWHQKGDNIAVSLRSNGKVDVGKIAQKYGGGGHKAAAGFKIKADRNFPWTILS